MKKTDDERNAEIAKMIREKGLAPGPRDASAPQGNLNHVRFLQDGQGNAYVLRRRVAGNRQQVRGYLSRLYQEIASGVDKGRVCFLSARAQARKMEAMKNAGIPVPRVIDSGGDWILMECGQGRRLSDIFREGVQQAAVTDVYLGTLRSAHRKGFQLWDRTGDNELFQEGKGVTFIDFDLDIRFPRAVPEIERRSYDLACALRSLFFIAARPDAAQDGLQSFLHSPASGEVYYLPHLAEVINLQSARYERLGQDVNINASMRKLAQSISGDLKKP